MESYREERWKRYQENHHQYITSVSLIGSELSSHFEDMQNKAGHYVSAFTDWASNKKRTIKHN